MTTYEKVAQLLALARSTSFAGERDTAVRLARTLFNKHRLTDPHLRWELLTALGQEAGPEPARPAAPSAREGRPEEGAGEWWREWMAAEQAEQERWRRDWMKRTQRRQRAERAGEQTRTAKRQQKDGRRRRGRPGRAGRQRKRVRVRGHDSARTIWGVPSYTREIATRAVRFTCAWCQDTVTQQRFPGPLPVYCSEACKKEAQREQTRERVRRYRERQR